MQYTIWHGDTFIGSADLPDGELVTGPLIPALGYRSVAGIVRRSTDAFLHLGLFCGVDPSRSTRLETREWFAAIQAAGQLRFVLMDSQGEAVAARFVNLLDSAVDDGIVVLVSLDDRLLGRPAMIASEGPIPTSSSVNPMV